MIMNYKIRTYFVLFFLLFVCHVQADEPQGGSSQQKQLAAVIPFRQYGNSIAITLRLNDSDRPLSFLLDTGADGMAIRKSLADSLQLNIARSQTADVVGAQIKVDISAGNAVHLSEELVLNNQNIAVFETVSGFDGIIGLNLIYRYVTEVNFDEQKIYLYQHGSFPPRADNNRIAIPIERLGALLVIPAELSLTGGDMITGNFIMDTGANYQLILFSKYVRKNRLLLSGFKAEGQSATVSMGQSTTVYHGKAHTFKVGEDIVLRDIEVTLQASTGRSDSQKDMPDGSVGIQFFNRYNFIIDVPGSMIYLEARKTEGPY